MRRDIADKEAQEELLLERIQSIQNVEGSLQRRDNTPVIGEGAFGRVYKVEDKAVKVPFFSFYFDSSEEILTCLSSLEKEISITSRLNHPNVLAVREIDEPTLNSPFVLVTDYMPNGSLLTYAFFDGKRFLPITDEEKANIVIGVVNGLDYLQQIGIIHRDIKPENILLDTAGKPKIADFGSAIEMHPGVEVCDVAIAGTPTYFPPEYFLSKSGGKDQFEKAEVSYSVDLFALAIICIELFSGIYADEIFEAIVGDSIVENKRLGAEELWSDGQREKRRQITPSAMGSTLKSLCRLAMSLKREDRPDCRTWLVCLKEKSIFAPQSSTHALPSIPEAEVEVERKVFCSAV